jgi:hypothetical protein
VPSAAACLYDALTDTGYVTKMTIAGKGDDVVMNFDFAEPGKSPSSRSMRVATSGDDELAPTYYSSNIFLDPADRTYRTEIEK